MIRPIAGAAVFAVSGCLPATSAPEPEPPPVEWVVESSLYSRGTDTHWVICVPAADLALLYTERETRKEVVPEDPAVAHNADEGDPCPEGSAR